MPAAEIPRNVFTRIFLASFLLLANSLLSAADSERHFLWHAETPKGQNLYLLGSLHFGNAAMYPLPKVIMDSYNSADVIVVEADISENQADQLQQLSMGIYQDGSSLREHVPEDTWALVQQTCQQQGLPEELFVRQKPWAASMTLSVMAMTSMGLSSEFGIDHYFLEKAREDRKPVKELESIQQQLMLLDSLAAVEQGYLLHSTLEELSGMENNLSSMLAAWQSGDSAAMSGLVLDTFHRNRLARHINHKIFTERNLKMAAKIQLWLRKTESDYFVIVGAGHLLGGTGLVRLLELQGFKFTQL